MYCQTLNIIEMYILNISPVTAQGRKVGAKLQRAKNMMPERNSSIRKKEKVIKF